MGASRTILLALAVLGAALPARAQDYAALTDLSQLSLEQLTNVRITSVSKRAEALGDAPAAVYVITREDILRAGAYSLPDMLRLAPNLQVAAISGYDTAITARGFNGNAANKLLVLIDGRSIYTPLYGGVQWDMHSVPPDAIERIEVISGPGATLWGANAVNGVINIITRPSAETEGGVLSLAMGSREARGSLQYGGRLDDDLTYRATMEGFTISNSRRNTGAPATDGWHRLQGGFRLDYTPGDETFTLQGNMFGGVKELSATLDQDISGGNLQLGWTHNFNDGSALQLFAYYDRSRAVSADGNGYTLNTYNFEFQRSLVLGSWNELVWGGGYRLYQDRFTLVGDTIYVPRSRNVSLGNIFVQDTMTLSPRLQLVLGLKLESAPFSGLQPLPNARLSWKVDDDTLLWAAISRAVRAPTRFDVDLVNTIIPSILILTGDRNFRPEKLDAYEIGARMQLGENASLSLSAYYNVYDDLRSVEFINAVTLPLLWAWGNKMTANTYGLEVWGNYAVSDWWKLSAGGLLQHQDRRFDPDSNALGGAATAGNDPNYQLSLRSAMNLGPRLHWHADLRWIGMLHDPEVSSYVELGTRLAFDVTDRLQIAVSGNNLLHRRHLEYLMAGATVGNMVERSVLVETRLRF